MEPIPITFDSQAPAFLAFNNKIDAVTASGDLWLNTISALDQLIKHLEFESRLTFLAQRLDFSDILTERLTKVSYQAGVQCVFAKSGFLHRPE